MNPFPILILDDDTSILLALQETLKGNGYSCYATSQVSQALSALDETKFSIVISDQRMAEMTGLDFLYQVKEKQALCARILITGVLTTEVFMEAINRVEVFRCIPKPWTQDTLLKSIREAYNYFIQRIAYPKAHQEILNINRQLVKENAQLRQQIKMQ